MNSFFQDAVFFGVFISLASYFAGAAFKKKWKFALINPLLISIILTILVLLVFHIDYETYNAGAKYLSYFLTPATVCLAVPLYEQLDLLKKNWKAILLGITSGVLTSLCCVLLLAIVFQLDHAAYVTLLPKSVTSAIGMGVSEELGGHVSITIAIIIITGIIGNIFAENFCKIFRITNPIAKGIAIGTSAHAIATSKALEMGEIEGAMSSLSIVVAGLLTVLGANLFAFFY